MSTSVILSPIFNYPQFQDNDGNPLAGGKIYSYQAGSSTTLQTTWSDADGLIPNSNPIVLDSSGRLTTSIWLQQGQFYRLVLTTANGTSLNIFDNVSDQSKVSTIIEEETRIATAGQTTVTFVNSFIVGSNSLEVYVNGAAQILNTDYTETTTNSITFTSPLHEGDIVFIRIFGAIVYTPSAPPSTITTESITATQDQTVIPLTTPYTIGGHNLEISLNGAVQIAGTDYNETTTQSITFLTPLNAGDVVYARIYSVAVITGSDADIVTYKQGAAGSISTTVGAKLKETVSVLDFGAAGDGVTNDTNAIQLALDSGAGHIFVPVGTYNINTLNIPSNVVLEGAGKDLTNFFIITNTNLPGIRNKTQTGAGNTNITLRNFTILGNGVNQSDSNNSFGIQLILVTNTKLENIKVTGTRSWATACLEGSGLKYINVECSGVLNASHSGFLNGASVPSIRSVNDALYENCTSSDNGQDGFTLEHGSDIRVIGCRATGNGQTGIKVARTDRTTVTGCFCQNNTNGYKVQGPNQAVSFTGNIAYRNKDSGFFLSNIDTTNTSFELVLTGNQAIENGQAPTATSYGYAFENIVGSTISDVIVTGNLADDQQVTKTQTRGFSFGGSGTFSNVTMTGNAAYGSTVSYLNGGSLTSSTLMKVNNLGLSSSAAKPFVWSDSLQRLNFWTDNLVQSSPTVTLTGNGTTRGYVMPRAGQIRSLAVKSNAAITAGNANFQVRVNGSINASFNVSLNTANPTFAVTDVLPRVATFAAGDVITVTCVGDSSLLPNGTADFDAVVDVLVF